MKIIIIMFLVFSSFNYVDAQWVQISTIPIAQLNAVKFFDQFTGVVVGSNGVWRSTNSGNNWAQVLLSGNLNAISFTSTSVGFVVGDSGKVYKTVDGGNNWTALNSGTNLSLYGVYFISSQLGWAVGKSGKILVTGNSGNSWTSQNSSTTEDLHSVYMYDNNNGYIGGGTTNEFFALTNNQGVTWITELNQSGNTISSICIKPPGFNTVIAIGNSGRIKRTTNFGTSWTLFTSGTNQNLNNLQVIDSNNVFVVGNSGIILKSTDSGITWNGETTNTQSNLFGISMITASIGWAVGQNGIVERMGIPVAIGRNNYVVQNFLFKQNYPNPFNPTTNISFILGKKSLVHIDIFDTMGKFIESLMNSELEPGFHSLVFNSNIEKINLSSGIYFCVIVAGNYSRSIKMLLIK